MLGCVAMNNIHSRLQTGKGECSVQSATCETRAMPLARRSAALRQQNFVRQSRVYVLLQL